MVKLLLETGKVNVDSKDKHGQTPLWHAADGGNSTVAKLLLETGKAEVDWKDNGGRTPLSQVASMHALIDYTHGSLPPFSAPAYSRYTIVLRLLLHTGKVDVNSKDNGGRTPLSLAIYGGHEATVRLLLDTGKVDILCYGSPHLFIRNGRISELVDMTSIHTLRDDYKRVWPSNASVSRFCLSLNIK